VFIISVALFFLCFYRVQCCLLLHLTNKLVKRSKNCWQRVVLGELPDHQEGHRRMAK